MGHSLRTNNHNIVVGGRSAAFWDRLDGEVIIFLMRSKNLLWEPVVRARRCKIEENLRGTLSAKRRNAKASDRWDRRLVERGPLFWPRALLI